MTFTRRYATNLLQKGFNNEFRITKIEYKFSMVRELVIGYYYVVEIRSTKNLVADWVGVTIHQAVENCLHHGHGVTFR